MKTELITELRQVAEMFDAGPFRDGWAAACNEMEARVDLSFDKVGGSNTDLVVLETLANSVRNTALIIPGPNVYSPCLLILAIAALEYLESRKPHDGGSRDE